MATGMDIAKSEQEIASMYVCKDFSDLSACFAKLHISLNSKIDTLETKVSVLQEKTADLEKHTEYVDASFTNLKENVIVRLENAIEREREERNEAIEKESRERLKLEMWNRKWNIIIRGIAGNLGEGNNETERKVRCFLLGDLGMDSATVGMMGFAAVHRLPGGDPGKKNIIVRFLSLRQRDEVMQKVMKLPSDCEISVVPDVPERIGRIRSELLRQRKEMPKDQKKNYKLSYIKNYPFVALTLKRKDTGKVETVTPKS